MKTPKHLFLIVIHGHSGVGKTTLAEYLYTDLSNTAHIGVDHIKRFISEFREKPAHDAVSRNVIKAMVVEYLKNGISVIVEQGMSRAELEVLKAMAQEHNAAFLVYRVGADRSIADERAQTRQVLAGKQPTKAEILDMAHQRQLDNDYPDDTVFDSGSMSTEEIAERILKDLSDRVGL